MRIATSGSFHLNSVFPPVFLRSERLYFFFYLYILSFLICQEGEPSLTSPNPKWFRTSLASCPFPPIPCPFSSFRSSFIASYLDIYCRTSSLEPVGKQHCENLLSVPSEWLLLAGSFLSLHILSHADIIFCPAGIFLSDLRPELESAMQHVTKVAKMVEARLAYVEEREKCWRESTTRVYIFPSISASFLLFSPSPPSLYLCSSLLQGWLNDSC